VDLGVHLPLIPWAGEPISPARLRDVVDGARECGLAAVSANDHLVFSRDWLDGPTALASVAERADGLTLALTALQVVVRGPVASAKLLAALSLVADGRLVAGLGPGSSAADHELAGVPFAERWARFDEALTTVRALLERSPPPRDARFYRVPADVALGPAPPAPVPLWVASWGSPAGLARVARAGDGWLASAYNTTPSRFAAARAALPASLPSALATMWTWICDDRAEAERVLAGTLGPLLGRAPDELRGRVCVGPAEACAELLSAYAAAGCRRVYLWPLGDERRQLERVAAQVAPLLARA
jgi:alkanesulfonate monooxygenase SsuD/methylene tetrahydromethanopterin reductase-like flavin-dependent oxidoreductase (luciferase family)